MKTTLVGLVVLAAVAVPLTESPSAVATPLASAPTVVSAAPTTGSSTQGWLCRVLKMC